MGKDGLEAVAVAGVAEVAPVRLQVQAIRPVDTIAQASDLPAGDESLPGFSKGEIKLLSSSSYFEMLLNLDNGNFRRPPPWCDHAQPMIAPTTLPWLLS